jgi:hypothetical protein
VPTRSTVLDHQLRELAQHLAALVDGLSTEQALTALLEAGAVRVMPFHQLAGHLEASPDALTSGDPRCPLIVVRLTHTLAAMGCSSVRPPGCGDCGRVIADLRLSGPNGRRCQPCSNRANHRPCSRCGKSARIMAKDPAGTGGFCGKCRSNDPRFTEECGQCGRRRPVARRFPDGSPLCSGCAPRLQHTCVLCGTEAPAQTITADGPVCRSCYPRVQPRRPCGRCGQLATIEVRSTDDGSPDLCSKCYLHEDSCQECGRFRSVQRYSGDGRLLCRPCRLRLFGRPLRECARCHQHAPAQAEWPMGPVCNSCYNYVRTHPGQCTRCSQPRILIAAGLDGRGTCGPCSGADLDYLCRICGQAGDPHSQGCCARCVLADRLSNLLTSSETPLAEPLRVLAAAFNSVDRPYSILNWLTSSSVAALLAELAASGFPFTHDALDGFPLDFRVHFIRNLLVQAGALPARTEYIDRINPWLDHLLADKPAQQVTVILPFAHWAILRKARRRAAKQVYTPRSGIDARKHISTAASFLAWLDERGLELQDCTQSHLDEWLTTNPQPEKLRSFIRWASRHHLITGITLPSTHRKRFPDGFIDEDQRWEQLDRCLNDDTLPLTVRIVGALILLFGLGTSRALHLTTDNILRDGPDTYLVMDQHPLILPPRLGTLIRTAADTAHSPSAIAKDQNPHNYLFPGHRYGHPINPDPFGSKLNRYGIKPRRPTCAHRRRHPRTQHQRRHRLGPYRPTRLGRLRQPPSHGPPVPDLGVYRPTTLRPDPDI